MLISGLFILTIGTRPARAQAFAYVTNVNGQDVSVINTVTNTVVDTIIVGSNPVDVAITPDGAFAYVVNNSSGTVSVIATTSNTVIATVGVGSFPRELAITPDGAFAYVGNNGSGTVSVIATATNSVVATVGVGASALGVAITPDGNFAYVANGGSNTVSVIDIATNTVVATIGGVQSPEGIAITIGPVGITDERAIPTAYALSQNFPNPFNPKTIIKYDISEFSFVTLKIYDVLGNEITTLVNKEISAGSYEVEFNATTLPSSIYFYQLQAGSFVETKKMVLMK